MFYDLYCELCDAKGVPPTRAAIEIGISKSSPTTWKNSGGTPGSEIISKIAEYFDVSVDYLLGKEEKVGISGMFWINFEKSCTEKGMTPAQVAKECGIGKSNVSLWKNKGYVPRAEAIRTLAEYLGVTVDYLLGKEKSAPADTGEKVYACLIGKWVCLNDDPNCLMGTNRVDPVQWYKENAVVYAPKVRSEEHTYYQLDYVHISYFGKDYRINPIFIQIVSE